MKKSFLAYTAIAACIIISACSKANEQDLAPVSGAPTCDTVNMKLAANVVPILSANCYSCHGFGSAQGGVKLDVYSELKIWVNAGALIGSITHASNYSPMPKNGAKLSDCDINKIRSWINRGALNN